MPINKRKTPKGSEEPEIGLVYSSTTRFRYWESHLFNDVYLRKDVPAKHSVVWGADEDPSFQKFLTNFRNLCDQYKSREKELSAWSETETINNWIKYLLEDLGWTDKCPPRESPFLEETSFRYQDKTYRTDILIVDLPKEKQHITKAQGDARLLEARESVIIPVEAKYWNRLEQYRQGEKEDRKRIDTQSDDIGPTCSPDDQIVAYMKVLHKDWGILTDGSRWRLYNRTVSGEDSQRYFEFNLFSLFQSIVTEETEEDRKETLEAAKYFYFFFSKRSIFPGNNEEPFVNEVLRYSKKYINTIEEDLRVRFVKAMNIACNGFNEGMSKAGGKATLQVVRNISESALFNLLFIKSLESRNILPMSSQDYRKISLSTLIDKIERFDPEKESEINDRNLKLSFQVGNGQAFSYRADGNELHDKIVRLTKVIHDGESKKDDFGFEIAGFRESVFSDQEWKFFQNTKLTNDTWVRILFQIGYAASDTLGRKYQQIPYSYFTARQLGSIYESFLEFKLDRAEEDLVFEKKQWKPAQLESNKYRNLDIPKVKKGHLYFTPNNADRKATGSYYTADLLVVEVVRNALAPILKKCKSSKEILKLRVCDPTMGSGHFLSGALAYLTREYLSRLASESKGDLSVTVAEAKRTILDSCIFGSDINPSAVKLAKMSLWLQTAHHGWKLERLDDQLKSCDSLIPYTPDYSQGFREVEQYDCIVSNPPWDKLKFDEEEFFERFTTHTSNKFRSKTEKQKEFERLLSKPEVRKQYETEKSEVESKISAVESKFYKHQANVSDTKSRHIDHNLYKLALEKFFRSLKKGGRIGIVVPTGVLGDLGCSGLRNFLMSENSIELIIGFRKDAGLFPISQACCFAIGESGGSTSEFSYLDNLNEESFKTYESMLIGLPKISRELIEKLDPQTKVIPFFENSVEYSIVEKMYQSVEKKGSFWPDFGRELHQTDDAKYLTEASSGAIRVVKGDEIDHFFLRAEGKQFLNQKGMQKYKDRISDAPRLCIRAISGLTDPRRIVVSLVPGDVLTVNSVLVAKTEMTLEQSLFILALMNSRAVEYRFRQVSKNNNVNKYAIMLLPLPNFDKSNATHARVVSECRSLLARAKSDADAVCSLDKAACAVYGLSKDEYAYLVEKIAPADVKPARLLKVA